MLPSFGLAHDRVDVALVLAVDMSSSIDDEKRFQRQVYASGLLKLWEFCLKNFGLQPFRR